MADVNNPQKGDIFYYLGRTRVTVVDDTLRPGGVNSDEAFLQLETDGRSPISFMRKHAGRYLTAERISLLKKWPLTPDSGR